MAKESITKVADRYLTTKELIKKLKKEEDADKATLKEYLASKPDQKSEVGGFVLSLSSSWRTYADNDKLKAAGLWDEYSYQASTDRLDVKKA